MGILDETQLNGSVDAARHSIFKGDIGEEEYRMVNGWNIRCKKCSTCDDAEPNGSAEEKMSGPGKQWMRMGITSSRAVRLVEEPSTIWEDHPP